MASYPQESTLGQSRNPNCKFDTMELEVSSEVTSSQSDGDHSKGLGDETLRDTEEKCLVSSTTSASSTEPTSFTPFQGKIFADNRGTVLSQHTIWTPWSAEADYGGLAPWPTQRDYIHTGDERHRRGNDRHFPIPRVPLDMRKFRKWENIADLPILDPHPMDRVRFVHVSKNGNRSGAVPLLVGLSR